MSTTPDRFGSLSGDAYRIPAAQALPPFEHEEPNEESQFPVASPKANTNQIGVTYNIDKAVVPQTQAVHTDAPPHAPNSWEFGRDPYKIDGVSDSGVGASE